MEIKRVDARGLACPKPLIMTKKALTELRVGDAMEVLIDNETSQQNVGHFLRDNGAAFETRESGGVFTLTVTKGRPELSHPDAEGYCAPGEGRPPHVICIKNRTMGLGDDALGEILIKAFVNTIKDASPLPGSIVLYNSGIFIALKDSPVIEALRDLERRGVKILACGTCLDYYQKKAELGAGRVSNMYDIMQALTSAGHVIVP